MKISVIIPCFNAADTIQSCLQSVVDQDVAFELIVKDGGSTDNTNDIILSFQDHISHHITSPDKGVYDAMNQGIDLATGDWIYFLGADDELASPQSLSGLISAAENDCALVIGRTRNLPPRHAKVPEWYEPVWDRSIRLRNNVHHQGVAYRESVFASYRYPERFKILADYHLNLLLFFTHKKASISSSHVANCGSDGLSKLFNEALYKEEWLVKKAVLSKKELWYQPAWLMAKYLRKKIN